MKTYQDILHEELGRKFWNQLIQMINKKFGSGQDNRLAMMLRQDKETYYHQVMMVNTFHEFPKAFVDLVKQNMETGTRKGERLITGQTIDLKGRVIRMNDDNWKRVFRAVKKAKGLS